MQVQQRRPPLVHRNLAGPVFRWQSPGEHLGDVGLVPEPAVDRRLGGPRRAARGQLEVQADSRGDPGDARQLGECPVVAAQPGPGGRDRTSEAFDACRKRG